jgi:hypothetical protein
MVTGLLMTLMSTRCLKAPALFVENVAHKISLNGDLRNRYRCELMLSCQKAKLEDAVGDWRDIS